MDQNERIRVSRRLNNGANLDKQAAAFCELMTSPASHLHDCEGRFTLKKRGQFAFDISAHHRTLSAQYGQVILGELASDIRGRYQFYLLPEELTEAASKPELLVEFTFDSDGEFKIGGEEAWCNPVEYQKSGVRNTIATHLINAVQQRLSPTAKA